MKSLGLSLLATLLALICGTRAASTEDLEWVALDSLDAGLVFDIRYGTKNNFTGEVLYAHPRAYMRRTPAMALLEVQRDLQKLGLGLKLFDAYRPLPVQQKMLDLIQDERYVSNPAVNSGRHTRGTAVDVSLVDGKGKELSMPTDYDNFTEKAHSSYAGKDVTDEQKTNRLLLRKTMEAHGFTVYPSEWWHFDYKGWEAYPPADTPIEDIQGN